jgi:hypothetical protein
MRGDDGSDASVLSNGERLWCSLTHDSHLERQICIRSYPVKWNDLV